MNGCHVENPSWFASRKPAICLTCVFSSSSSKVFKLEITVFQLEKAVCESGSLFSEFRNVVGLQKSTPLFKLWPISVSSSSSSSEK